MGNVSQLEAAMLFQIKAVALPMPVLEHRLCQNRRWRFDMAWPSLRLALEVEGGTYANGRHSRPKGFEADCEKYNQAVLDGWSVLRVTGDMVRDGRAIKTLEDAMNRQVNR